MNNSIVSAAHLRELQVESAISLDVIHERGYRTIIKGRDLPPEFSGWQRDHSGLLIPIHDTNGRFAGYLLKPDKPPVDERGRKSKYLFPKGASMCLDVPVRVSRAGLLRSPEVPLWITEGVKKVDSALTNGIPAVIGVAGVWNWQSGKTAISDWRDIALADRDLILAFDSDVMRKAKVRDALDGLAAYLEGQKARVRYVLLPDLPDGSKCGLDDFFASGRTREELDQYIVDALPDTEPEWADPIPLDESTGPDFPVDALPENLRTFVVEVAEQTQTPPDMAAVAGLGAISAAIGGKFVVHHPHPVFDEPAHIQSIVVADPGTRKSAVMAAATAPIEEWERERWPEDRRRQKEWDSRNRVLERDLSAAENAVGKPNKDGTISDGEARRLEALHALEKHGPRPALTRVIYDDATPEKLKSALAEQGGAIANLSAESASLSNISGQYSNQPNLDVFLKGHAGDPIRVDRRGRETEIIPRPSLTVCLMVQPFVVRNLGRTPGFIERGAAARLLPSFPKANLGYRSIDPRPVSFDTTHAWTRLLRTLLEISPETDLLTGNYTPFRLHLASDAYEVLKQARAQWEVSRRPGGSLEPIADWANKLDGAVLRLAGLLHLAQHPTTYALPICPETVESAIALGSYFTEHARIMYRMLAGESSHEDAREVWHQIERLANVSGSERTFSFRELHQSLRGRTKFARARDLRPALATLEELGWIRIEFLRTGGRRTELIRIHPSLHPLETLKSPCDSVIAAPLSVSRRESSSVLVTGFSEGGCGGNTVPPVSEDDDWERLS